MVNPLRNVINNEAEENLDTTYDTSDKEAVNRVRKKSARTRATRLEFVSAAMTTEQGRAWFYDLLVRCRVVSTPYIENSDKTIFNLGQQNVGLMVLDDIQTAAPDDYVLMITENKTKNG
jgi:hypothetical protein